MVTRAKFALTVPKWKETAQSPRMWQHLPVSAMVSGQGHLAQGGPSCGLPCAVRESAGARASAGGAGGISQWQDINRPHWAHWQLGT